MKKVFLGVMLTGLISQVSFADKLDQKSATVFMKIAKFAKISELNDFQLFPESSDGDASSVYSGADSFRLESNCPVIVTMEGNNMSNGEDQLKTGYALDQADSIQTQKKHDGKHQVSAVAQLGNISEQAAGDYKSQITLTVSAL